jgi:CobQ-like glutamine amidotransferase family enzyme/UDP-N-acetylmuramyl tripeptide synthase
MRTGTLRTRVALVAARLVSEGSRRAGFGSGSTVGGRAGLLLDPGLLAVLGTGRTTALVSGTNGKTTTTALLAEAVRTLGGVATAASGANLPPGLVGALAAAPDAPYAVLEIDEGYLPGALATLRPAVVALLNLSRDQLDRVSEVRKVAQRWRDALAGYDGVVVANVDDPLVCWASEPARTRRAVAAGGMWHGDAYHCPACGARLTVSPDGWACACGFARPEPDARLSQGALALGGASALPVRLGLPGRFNEANAALAAVAAGEIGVSAPAALAAMAAVREVAGRFATATVGRSRVRLLLAKNPAGWSELLELVRAGSDPVVIGINARIADGRDPSWLWDVPFEVLAGRPVVATGERRRDLAVRLRHAGVEYRLADDAVAALADAGGAVDYIGNYTAFQELRHALSAHPAVPASGGLALASPSPRRPASAPAPRSPRRESALRVVLVHPDLLGTYGDGGNARVLANRARWRGIDSEIVIAGSDVPLPASADLYLLGGGEDGPQAHAARVLCASPLADAVEHGAVVLAVCAGYQILGRRFPGADGTPLRGVGLLGVETTPGTAVRAVGELVVAPLPQGAPEEHELLLTGFENHAGRTRRDDGVAALGQVRHGIGNGDGTDGARVGRVLGTYLHGPVLARNPRLADELLALVTGEELEPLEDHAEVALRRERLAAPRRMVAGRGRR